MTQEKELNCSFHHLCIFDDKSGENMIPDLRWNHAINQCFFVEILHVTVRPFVSLF